MQEQIIIQDSQLEEKVTLISSETATLETLEAEQLTPTNSVTIEENVLDIQSKETEEEIEEKVRLLDSINLSDIPKYIHIKIGNLLELGASLDDIKVWNIKGSMFGIQEDCWVVNTSTLLDALIDLKEANPGLQIISTDRVYLEKESKKLNTVGLVFEQPTNEIDTAISDHTDE